MLGLPRRLPAGVARSLGVPRGENLIAWGSDSGSDSDVTYAIATSRALYVPSAARIPWHRIARASWDEPVLEVELLQGGGHATEVVRVRLENARDLPPAVHDRVTDSVIVSERVELNDGAGARMVARRDSDDGSIHWSVVFDVGLDPDDPALRATVDDSLGRLRDSLGI